MAALTEALETRLRRRLGVGAAESATEVFTTEELEDIYAEASTLQSADTLIFQQAVVIGYEELLADSAKQVNYKANQSSENMSDVSKHLATLLKYHLGKLADMDTAQIGAGQYAAIKPRDTRWKDLPNA